jgi:hypothetical protein
MLLFEENRKISFRLQLDCPGSEVGSWSCADSAYAAQKRTPLLVEGFGSFLWRWEGWVLLSNSERREQFRSSIEDPAFIESFGLAGRRRRLSILAQRALW